MNSIEKTVLEFLAISSYKTYSSEVVLDLKWSPDEKIFLSKQLKSIYDSFFLQDSSYNVIEKITSYSINDPYGSIKSSGILSDYFECNLNSRNVFAGSGVLSLLYDLSYLSNNESVLLKEYSYSDFLVWSKFRNAKINILKWNSSVELVLKKIREIKPKVLFLEQPTIFGKTYNFDEIKAISNLANKFGTWIIIDESNANYIDNSLSLVNLVNILKNIIVLRGLSKGYGLGGLRASFLISHELNNNFLKRFIAPLQISEFSYLFVLKILNNKYFLDNLKKQIKQRKDKVIEHLTFYQFQPILTENNVPWLIFWGDDAHIKLKNDYKIDTKVHKYPDFTDKKYQFDLNSTKKITRLHIPLSDNRLKLFENLLKF